MATAMYYSGYDPRTMKPVYVPRDPHEKAMQRALMQYRNPKNYDLVHEALVKAGREDLIGFGEKCLIRPVKLKLKPKVNGEGKKGKAVEKQNTKKQRPEAEKGKHSQKTEKKVQGKKKR